MHIAVAIVGFRNADDILQCLDALQLSSYSDFEVIVCENGGDDAFASLSTMLPGKLSGGQQVRVVQAPGNVGYAGGLNICIRETRTTDAWWILNPDTYPHTEAMAALVERLLLGDCDAVGGVVYLKNGTIQCYGGWWQPWCARAVSIGYGRPLQNLIDQSFIERRQNYLSGASMMVTKRFVELVGPLREDYFLYGEEVEWCIRAVRRGMRLAFAPGAFVLHFEGTTTGSAIPLRSRGRLPIHLGERNQMLLTRDKFPWLLPIAAPLSLFILFFRCARSGGWKQLFYGVVGWAVGLLNERGRPSWV